ncbi:hypothetical protein E2C01_033842 [Portunus trituberculatus]|uniref:Uncharacterized protein n=1 Tax=Portunus trituberculatus TaxID=210409 RepID=A0A5B7F4J1_PORTR|nr:hypothetical protein [Portunus trituberculatus]
MVNGHQNAPRNVKNHKRITQQLIKGTDGPGKPTISEWFKSYNIKSSWDEVKTSTMNLECHSQY